MLRRRCGRLGFWGLGCMLSLALGPLGQAITSSLLLPKTLPSLPLRLPEPDAWGVMSLPIPGAKLRPLTIIPELQEGLDKYIRNHGEPIAALVMVDVSNGHILAMVQGKDPKSWGGKSHSALYEGYPAASLFKMVATVAALDIAAMQPKSVLGVHGGCGVVHPQGIWLREPKSSQLHTMSLGEAFASSCNTFYAKLALQYLGVSALNSYAERLGWGRQVQADFYVEPSPINPPQPEQSAIHTVGSYAAGFGMVGLSPIHAAWISLAIAREGMAIPLKLFADHGQAEARPIPLASERLISQETSRMLREMMHATVSSGTAAPAFSKGEMSKIKLLAGGKTGTLKSKAPQGLTTWFAGLMPYEQPQVVVSAVVVNQEKWVIKGTHLAAEAFRLWYALQEKGEGRTVSQKVKENLPRKG